MRFETSLINNLITSLTKIITPSTGERYDRQLDSWVAIASLNTPRRSLTLGVLGGPMYAFGGYDGASSLKSVERFDPQSNCWTRVRDIIKPSLFLFGNILIYHIRSYSLYDIGKI